MDHILPVVVPFAAISMNDPAPRAPGFNHRDEGRFIARGVECMCKCTSRVRYLITLKLGDVCGGDINSGIPTLIHETFRRFFNNRIVEEMKKNDFMYSKDSVDVIRVPRKTHIVNIRLI